ncbi:MAG TPA: DUF6286 domain-containing protein [Acidimicrobiales bacterium]|nr:DUF6286 domain-containing protein [Acidimicrobiales bacterium]
MTVFNRLLGLALGLALFGAGLLAVVEAVLAFLGRPPWLVPYDQWAPGLDQLSWDDRNLMVAAALLVLAGILLVVLQLWPGRPSALRIADQRANRLAAIDGRGLQELLRRSAVDDGDVVHADVRVRRRAARVSGRVPQDAHPRTVQSRTRERVQARVDELRLQRPLKVKVDMKRSKARAR